LRWAVDQFQREDVLFRESEQFSLSAWLRHILRDREPVPTGGQAALCFVLMLSSTWFLMLYLARQGADLSIRSVIAGQLIILLPPVLMALAFTSDPKRTLRLAWPEKKYIVVAVALVVALNPLVNEMRPIVESLFPVSSVLKTALSQIMSQTPGLLTSILVFALIPAICEEFAFRGFILSGLEQQHRTRSAILLSALMFGFLHVLLSLFQQLFNATFLGIVLGLLAVRSRSIVPGIVFHFLNNAFAVALGAVVHAPWAIPIVPWIYRNPAEGLYHRQWIVASVLLSGFLLFALWKWKLEKRTLIASGKRSVEPAC
jgi:sodium transport system permease protein